MVSNVALIRGVGSHNGGAELLLRAARDQLSGAWSCVADMRRVNRDLLKEWSVGGYWDIPKLKSFRSTGWSLAPKRAAAAAGIYTEHHVDAVFDASGFFLGDQWEAEALARDAESFRRIAKRGKPIVMLPQAFGPFENREVADNSKYLLENVNLIVARDSVSVQHLKKLLGNDERIMKAPDTTIAIDVDGEARKSDTVAIVPNINIPNRMDREDSRGKYISSLAEISRRVSDAGLEPILLAHSSHGDPSIIAAVSQQVPTLRSITPKHGLESKELIASCRGVISGRYHAIVSALSQGAPAVAHSWSHKYGELLGDFGVRDGLADPFSATESVECLFELINNDEYALALHQNRSHLRSQLDDMWTKVGLVTGPAKL